MENESVVQALDELLAQIDDGELEATAPQRAYVQGAADALRKSSI